MIKYFEKTTLATIVTLALCYSTSTYASPGVNPALVAVDESEAVSIASMQVAGSFVEAELEREGGRSLWEVRLLTTAGDEVEVSIDADSGEIVSSETGSDYDDEEDEEDEEDDK